MVNDQHRQPLLREILHDGEHLADHLRVKRARRLVKEDDFGVHRQRAGNGDALLLSAGKLARFGVDIRVHADFLEILHRVFDALFAGAVEHLHLSGDAVIQHIHIAEQVELLKDHADFGVVARHVDRAGEDILAVVKDLSLVGRFQQVDAAQQRRFA